MSTYDDSSLFLYPSGYKASVLFAQKPMDANGQLAFTRSNDTATRVASNGLIEKVRTNLAAYSEQFDNAAWLKNGITVTANATTAPNGTMTADKVVDTLGGNNAYRIFNSVTLSAISYSASFYVKAAEYSWVYIRIGNALRVWFNVSTGVVGINDAGITGTIQSAGNGWYRCTAIIATATAGSGFSLLGLTNANGVEAYTPSTGGQGVFVWGAQLETGDIATDYIATTTAAVSVGPLANIPRIDYLGGGCGKLLLEPQRTNSALYSEQINNAAWNKLNVTVSANQAVGPDGTTSADLVYPTTTGADRVIEQLPVAVIGQTWTSSFFVKASGFSWVLMYAPNLVTCWFNASTGVFGTIGAGATARVLGQVNGYWRISLTGTLASSNAYLYVGPANANGTTTATANGTNGILIWGCQLEQGAYATSYIPTLGAAATRATDTYQKGGFGNTSTAGTLFCEFEATNINSANGMYLYGMGVGTTDTLGSSYATNANALSIIANGPTLQGRNNGYATTLFSLTPTAGATVKVAIRYDGTNVVAFVNGVKQTVYTDSAVGVKNFIRVNNGEQTSHATKQILFFPTGLTDQELQDLTTL